MSDRALDALSEAISEERPVILVAGQAFGASDTYNEAILNGFLDRLGRKDQTGGWRAALTDPVTDADMAWLSERFDRHVPSESTLRVFELPWSAVFTSSIDPRFAGRFETRGRQPEAVLSRGAYARVSRSRSRPPVYYLFGRANETVADARPPKTKADLLRRSQNHTSELLNRLAETATARGLVVIAGFHPERDWLDVDALLATLSDQAGVRAVWFGVPQHLDSVVADEMIAHGSLITTQTTIAEALASLELQGRVNIVGAAAPDEPGIVTTRAGILDITPQLRLRVEASARIVDDAWTEHPEPLEVTALHEAFRKFHGDLGGFRGMMEGVAREFAIQRSFETELWKAIEAAIRQPQESDSLVVLHGQSGTGKSVSLARLAWKVRRDLALPVLVAAGRLPTPTDIDAFCSEAERIGPLVTIVVCDANQPPWRYRDLAAALQSRGRRVVIVGSSYRIDEHSRQGFRRCVEAPATLSSAESRDLEQVVARFSLTQSAGEASPPEGWNALAWLYRHLSAGRQRIAAGISSEARVAESAVRERARSAPRASGRSALADQLIAAGIAEQSTQLFDNDEALAATGEDAAARLIDLVMVAGRLSCPVPLNLLMRVISDRSDGLGVEGVAHLFQDLDLFRWRAADAEGTELLISPRLQLEAELICQRRLADSSREIDCLIELIKGVRPSGVDRNIERTFVLDLLQKLDRDGPRGQAYRRGYLRFADALEDLRKKAGVRDASLMLRECVFRRQAIFSLDGYNSTEEMDEDTRLKVLDSARAVVEEALRLIDLGELHAGKRSRVNLIVERASIYGYLAVQRTNAGGDALWADYLAARTASARATAMSDDYHPFDVALWTSCDVLRGTALSDEQRAELLSDLYSTMDLADGMDFRSDQRIRYLERRKRAADVAENKELGDAALADLELVAPAAAAFLTARARSEPVESAPSPIEASIRDLANETATFLAQRPAAAEDVRCLRLQLRLRWAHATGEHLLRGERGKTPAGSAQISKLLELVRDLNGRLGNALRSQERYVEAVLTWLSGDTRGASDLWSSLSRDTEFEDRSRVVRRLVATDAAGIPMRYRGRIESGKSGEGWKVRVDGISGSVSLLGHEFREEDLAPGRELRDFGIAFNYVGPVIDPLKRPMAGR